MGPELVPLQYCPFRGTIQAKPHTNTTLSSLPWDIKSNKETPAWASVVHITQPEEESGQGWDCVEASETHLGHKSQGCTQCLGHAVKSEGCHQPAVSPGPVTTPLWPSISPPDSEEAETDVL